MKKVFAVAVALMMSMSVFAEMDGLKGVWKNGKVEMTFLTDTLMIDQIDNEGDIYTYCVDILNSEIHMHSTVFPEDTWVIKVVSLNSKRLKFYYLDDPKHKVYTFKRKKVQIPTMGWYEEE